MDSNTLWIPFVLTSAVIGRHVFASIFPFYRNGMSPSKEYIVDNLIEGTAGHDVSGRSETSNGANSDSHAH